MAHALASLGHTVFVIASDERDSRRTEGAVTVISLPLNAPKIITQRSAAQVLDYGDRVNKCVNSIHSDLGLDLVEFPDFGAEGYSFIVSGQTEPPHVLRLHTCLELVFRNDNRRWTPDARQIAQMETAAISAARHITSPSAFLLTLTSETTPLGASTRRIVPNGVDARVFTPANATDARTVLCPGRLQRLKGSHVLIQAVPRILKKFPDAQFIFAGRDTLSAPDGRSFQAYLTSLLDPKARPAVKFLGEVSRQEMVRLYSAAAVVAVPSLYDNFPNTVLEAMACARPVVAANVGGIPEIIRDGEGILVPPDNPERLALAVNRLLADRTLSGEIGRAALEAARARFAAPIVADEMTAAYQAILTPRGSDAKEEQSDGTGSDPRCTRPDTGVKSCALQ
jgi:glycosyltransferase involved in cell wall biosynthesis